jgi:type IV pilus assembly protein PilY1
MLYQPVPPLVRRWISALLALMLGLGPLATPAYAGLTPLADEPLNIKNQAKPNIVLTVDDSTSMLFDFLPDYVVNQYCRDGLGVGDARCGSLGAASDFTAVGGGKYSSPGYIFSQYNVPYSNYATGFDPAGPGGGCWGGSPPTCSPGIDPGALPGIAIYPFGPAASWPNSLRPYEYWSMWPPAVHNSALNHMYYNPRLTYDPPVDSTGTSYDQMDDAHTSTWTSVPADPWASPVVYVDLTAPIDIGQWCNSDWSVGAASDPTQCRVNGGGGAAFGTVVAADGQDYTYPWAPPNFTVSASAGATTASTYAAQKVTLNGSLTGTAITANWTSAQQDQKYFYENENILWCDITSPSWPQTGPTLGQTCNNPQNQTCSAFTQVCNKSPGSCNNYSAPKCNNLVQGTCNGFATSACGGAAGACNGATVASCNFGSCGNIRPETCNGTFQTCPTSPQTCSGPLAQTCNLPGTQTCVSQSCTTTYDPPGCNLLPPDPENTCSTIQTCPPPTCTPDPGKCTIQTSTSCTKDSDCTPQPGACSVSGKACMGQADCVNIGHCSTLGNLCTSVNDCAVLGGHCSVKNNITCSFNTDCPGVGTCSNNGATVCLVPTDCGQCNNPPGQVCTSVAQCTTINGTCNQKTCPDGTTACASSANCPANGACTTKSCTDGSSCPAVSGGACAQKTCPNGTTACTTTAQCGGQACTAKLCSSAANCPTTPGTCSKQNGQPWSQQPCNGVDQASADAQCRTNGTCNNGGAACTADPGTCPEVLGTCAKDATITCRSSSDCSSIGTCANTHAACNSQVPCANVPGNCTITNAACTVPGTDVAECPAIGRCSITNAQCTGNAQCPDQPGPLPPSAAVCSTGGVGGVATTTLRNDADTASKGVVCRHNNMAYTGTNPIAAGSYNYPSGKYITPITNGTGPDACVSTNHYAPVPRHYWKTEIEWCDHQISTPPNKWMGYGDSSVGSCQSFKDASHIYPRFHQFGSAGGTNNTTTSAFQRVDLDISKRATATYQHDWTDASGPESITRTFDEEMTNYANWFAYYRTRITAVKTVTSLTFLGKLGNTYNLDDTFRVGFHTLSNLKATGAGKFDPAKFVDVQDFDLTQKLAWYNQLLAINIPLGLETPTLNAMSRIGQYFSPGGSSELSGATDPIILSCQKNWHMLFTDGFTNQGSLPTSTVGDQDNTVPVTGPMGQLPVNGTTPVTITGITPGSAWPHPFVEDLVDPNSTASDAASDYSMNYWVTDLRPAMPMNVATSNKDPAPWPHLNFAAMSLGTQGILPAGNQSVVESQLIAGSLQWPKPQPTVFKPDQSGVDDLWHAAMNGRGRFVNAQSADELKLGMGQILQDVINQAGARSGAGFQSDNISGAADFIYRVRFEPGWGASVSKIRINTTTGAEDTTCVAPTCWEASAQLTAQLAVVNPGDTPWFTNRRIVTVDESGTPVPFRYDTPGIGPNQLDSLSPGKTARAKLVLEFLRGSQINEGTSIGQFRVRIGGLLGDIVDSQALYVGPPRAPYLDANDPGYSTNFKNAAPFSTRPARVYAGANDGMLHAFDDATGNEAWAFIPSELFRADKTGLGALSYQDGALPPFQHHFYVDSTPRITDVNFGGGSADWHTILVGGLGKGGHSYYALDISDPASITDETTAAQKVLWQFTNADMGYSYGRPVIAKTHAFGGKWVVMVAAGYNNPTGNGKIFILDAKDGSLLKTLATGVGSATTPSGLTHIAGYEKDFRNQIAEQIYAGDMLGNFWRFDISGTDETAATWGAPVLLANLTAPDGTPQAVTTPPQIEIDIANGIDRWVFIGTGRLLDDTDLTTPSIANQVQTFYAIRDGTASTPLTPWPATLDRTDLGQITAALGISGLTNKPDKGWYDDLPVGQRIVVPVQAALSLVAYVGTSPQTDPCLTGQPATVYAREYARGNSLLLDSNSNPVESIFAAEGGVGVELVALDGSGGGGGSGGYPDLRIAITAGTTGKVTFYKPKDPDFAQQHRMSWRLLGQ